MARQDIARIPHPNALIRPPKWTPGVVFEKLGRVVNLVNEMLPPPVFLQRTAEENDDVPVVRALVGPRDPYSAERFGSLAFYSTVRGVEWLSKIDGGKAFVANQGRVIVTFFEDASNKERPLLDLNIHDADSVWAQQIRALFDA